MRVLTSPPFLLDCPAEETSTRIRLPTISSNRSSVPRHPQTVRAKTLDPAFFGVCGPTSSTVCNHLKNWQVGQRTRKDHLLVLFAPLSSAQGTEVPSNRSITSLHPLKKERNNFCHSCLCTSSKIRAQHPGNLLRPSHLLIGAWHRGAVPRPMRQEEASVPALPPSINYSAPAASSRKSLYMAMARATKASRW